MTPFRLGDLLSSGILADVFDVEADLFGRHAVRKALNLEPLSSSADEVGKSALSSWRLSYRQPSPELHKELFGAIDLWLKGSLLLIARSENDLRAVISTLSLLRIKNRLVRAGVLSDSSVEAANQDEMRVELFSYVLAYRTLYDMADMDYLRIGEHLLLDLLPCFDVSPAEADALLMGWIKQQQVRLGISDERIRLVCAQIGLDSVQ